MSAIRFYKAVVFLLFTSGLYAQPVQPLPDYVVTKDASPNRFTLFVPDSNQLMVFQKNEFSVYTKEGRFISGPYTLRADGADVWYPRISNSGKLIAMYAPGKGWLEDCFMTLYNRDSGYLVGSYKIGGRAELNRLRFSGDTTLLYYTQLNQYKDIYTWNIKLGTVRNTFLKEDTVHSGVYDISFYKGKAVGVVREADSLGIFMTSNSKQFFQMYKLRTADEKIVAQFSSGYPYVLMGNESTGQTQVFKPVDTSFQLVSTLKQLPVIYGAAATEEACYILYKDSTQKKNPVLKLFNTKTNIEIIITGLQATTDNYIYAIYPEKGIFTASHLTNGSIIAFNLADGKQAWASSPTQTAPQNTGADKSIHAANKLFKVLIKQGSKDVSKIYYNQEANQLYLVKNNETLITVDADAKCAVRWEPFYKDENRIMDVQLLPGYRYVIYAEQRWKKDESKDEDKLGIIDSDKNRYLYQYPYTAQVFDRKQGKLIFNMQSREKKEVNFISDSLLYWSDGNYLQPEEFITVYNLNTGEEKNIHPFTTSAINGYTITNINNRLYYFFSNEEKLLLTNDKGKKIFTRTYPRNEGNLMKNIAFVDNSPYFYFTDADKKATNQLYKIQGDSAILIRKLPADIIIRATKATDKGCYFIYTKEYKRKTGEIFHNRIINMISGQDKLIDSVGYDNSSMDRGAYEIFPEQNFYTKTNYGEVTWHDLNTGYEFKNFGRDDATIVSLAYSPEGRYLAASSNGKVLLWDLGTGKETKSLAVENNGYITKLAFSGDGKYLAASSGDIWETASGKNIVSVTDGRILGVNSIDFSPDGKRIISGGVFIISWEAEYGSQMYVQQRPRPEDMEKKDCWNPNGCIKADYGFMVHSTAFHPNSRDFVTGNKTGIIQKWNTENSKQGAYAFLGETDGVSDLKVYDLKYTRDGKHIIAIQQKYIYSLDAETLKIEDSLLLATNEQIEGIDMGYDGQVFGCITKRNNGSIVQIRNINDLKVKQEFYTDGNNFNKISFSTNKKHAATSSEDGFCTIWDLATGKPAMYLNTIGDYGNIMVTPENYYMASKSALEGVTFFKDSSFYSFDQFDLYLNRPDIVLGKLGYASPELINFYRNAYFKRLKKATGNTIDTAINNYTPSLRLVNKKTIPVVSTKAMAALSFDVEDNAAKKGALQIFINGNLIKEHRFTETSTAILNYTDSVALGQGINNIEAVYKTTASIESRKEKVAITYSPIKPIAPKVWFIGVGISKYKDADMNLKYPVKDIKDLVIGFKKKYPGLIIDTLLNEKATKENIIALHEKLKNTSINDKVIVSFNGHGLLSDSLDWYFATYDVDFKKPENNGLSYTEMEGILNGIPARQKLLLMDACHSGEVDKETDITIENAVSPMDSSVVTTARGLIKKGDSKVGLQTSFELMQDLFANLNSGNGTTVLSAAGGKEYALESDKWKNGVFTYSVLKALKDPATDENLNDKISVKELKKAVFAAVQKLTGGRQKPTSRVEVLDDWEIW